VRIETFEQLINFGAGRQFSVSKAHQRKARNRHGEQTIASFPCQAAFQRNVQIPALSQSLKALK